MKDKKSLIIYSFFFILGVALVIFTIKRSHYDKILLDENDLNTSPEITQSSSSRPTSEMVTDPLTLEEQDQEILIPRNAIQNHLAIKAKDAATFKQILQEANEKNIKLLDIIPQIGWVLIEVKHSAHANELKKRYGHLIQDESFNYELSLPPPAQEIPQEDIIADGFGEGLAAYLGIPPDLGDWGQGVTVGVIDSGIEPSSFLGNSFTEEINLVVDNLSNPDARNHGTAVASLIAGQNNPYVQGIATGSNIISVDLFDNLGNSDILTLGKAITIATDLGAKVINLSLGASDQVADSGPLYEALLYASLNDVNVVAAAGNSNSQVSSPANSPLTLAIGSINKRGEKSAFANQGEEIDLVGPGSGIITFNGQDFVYYSGTSFSAPIISGALAGIRSSKPEWSAQEAETFLLENLQDIGEKGKDNQTGHGTIRVDKLINSLEALGAEIPRK